MHFWFYYINRPGSGVLFSFGVTTAQGLPPNKEGWGPLVPEVVQVPSDDIEALASLMSERSHEVAAVLSEPVQGAGGVWPGVSDASV